MHAYLSQKVDDSMWSEMGLDGKARGLDKIGSMEKVLASWPLSLCGSE